MGQPLCVTQSQDDGAFSFPTLPPATYTLVCYKLCILHMQMQIIIESQHEISVILTVFGVGLCVCGYSHLLLQYILCAVVVGSSLQTWRDCV